MVAINKYYNQIIKIDFINKYSYLNVKDIPKLEKIILNFGCKNSDLLDISSALLFLELITEKKSVVTKARRSNILLKIRKGNLVGCTVTLEKSTMYHFLYKLSAKIFPNFRDFEGISVSKKKLFKKGFSFSIQDFVCFKDFEKQFYLFSRLPPLNITLLSNSTSKLESLYLLQALKIPVVLKKQL